MRRATHTVLNESSASIYRPAQTAESIRLALRILHSPSQWHPYIRLASSSHAANLLYGPNPHSDARDGRVAEINNFVTRLSALLDAPHLVELFTFMKYIPAR